MADMFQTVWFIVMGFTGFMLVFCKGCYRDLNEKLRNFSCDMADNLEHVWLNVNITTQARTFTDVSKRHANKDLYSLQNCDTIIAHCFNTC